MTNTGPRRIKRHAFVHPTSPPPPPHSYGQQDFYLSGDYKKCAYEGCSLAWESEVHWVLDEGPVSGTDEVVTQQENETPVPIEGPGPHQFEGRLDQWCKHMTGATQCNRPDRDPIHNVSWFNKKSRREHMDEILELGEPGAEEYFPQTGGAVLFKDVESVQSATLHKDGQAIDVTTEVRAAFEESKQAEEVVDPEEATEGYYDPLKRAFKAWQKHDRAGRRLYGSGPCYNVEHLLDELAKENLRVTFVPVLKP